jgi:hypothetical protein
MPIPRAAAMSMAQADGSGTGERDWPLAAGPPGMAAIDNVVPGSMVRMFWTRLVS